MNRLDFEPVDNVRFPSVQMAYDCLESGLAACITLNAANEIAVEAFLSHKIAFLDIYKIIENQLNTLEQVTVNTLDEIMMLDQNVRSKTKSTITSK